MNIYLSLPTDWDLLEFLELEDLSLTPLAYILGLSFIRSFILDFLASCLMGEIIIELSSFDFRSRDVPKF